MCFICWSILLYLLLNLLLIQCILYYAALAILGPEGDDVLVRAHPGKDQHAEVYICSEGAEKKTYYVAKLLGLGDGKDGLDIVRWYQVDSKNRRKYSLKCKFNFRVCFHFFSSLL